MNAILVDTNVILRFLLGDHPEYSSAATKLFAAAEQGEVTLSIDPMIVAECCSVLEGRVYQLSKELIASHLVPVLVHDGVQCENLLTVLDALQIYSEHRLDFADAYLIALARRTDQVVATFGDKMLGVENVSVHGLS
ncbi:PIN domain-containing protein [Alicyclobacillus macrosporangiidus]|uniref:Predicted nucleic acid-binding protein, contains PIN domain n=1 Tax=Alicyclobacillus macrosporangiidus TaxID=392015 RepID=A0A1I7LI21_9BACL|nr:PIN domain-containing protein [Alicyclobacillus macrosporangiidus]SFV09310.1 Predicted nucleic acid-binding protein, contains PIN domain [Alicyclobacillus macrosporangiidus]